ncbi:MAG: transposase [Deltaproteobacteria bacterium]|nr:transposase [Deltaproteobacteria bacterium]
MLWHSDVCHGPAMKIAGRVVPLRIHALLDDHSRYVVAIQACATERESEMLALLVKALRRFHAPETLYLDNGSTYRGDVLCTACPRLGISLVHAQPHDPQARGKMERFWRTLREGCLDHLGAQASLHDVQVRLLAFVDQHYHLAPHASLMGKSPSQVHEAGRSQEGDRTAVGTPGAGAHRPRASTGSAGRHRRDRWPHLRDDRGLLGPAQRHSRPLAPQRHLRPMDRTRGPALRTPARRPGGQRPEEGAQSSRTAWIGRPLRSAGRVARQDARPHPR